MADRLAREKPPRWPPPRRPGRWIRAVYETKYRVDYKHNNSPVTLADHQANHRIHQIIQHAFPHDGWLSEETTDSPGPAVKTPRVGC